jgi:TetR/AcrR family fatty acid metabolism transcriptional regulator
MTTDSSIGRQNARAASLKEAQREERTALILRAAYDILIAKGYYETSMDEIAARVGISKGTLYLHFKSKEDLVFMMIEQAAGKFLSLIDEIIAQDISVRDRLEQVLLESYKNIQSGRQFLLALRSIGLNRGLVRDRLEGQASIAGLIARLNALFEEGQARGELNAAIPTAVMVSVFLSLMEIYGDEQSAIHQTTPEYLLASVSQLLFHGVLAKP